MRFFLCLQRRDSPVRQIRATYGQSDAAAPASGTHGCLAARATTTTIIISNTIIIIISLSITTHPCREWEDLSCIRGGMPVLDNHIECVPFPLRSFWLRITTLYLMLITIHQRSNNALCMHVCVRQ